MIIKDDEDRSIMQSLAEDVILDVITQEVQKEENDDNQDKLSDDSNYSDASSLEFDENKHTKIAPIKRMLDQQHQLNKVQKKMLSAYLSKYNDENTRN